MPATQTSHQNHLFDGVCLPVCVDLLPSRSHEGHITCPIAYNVDAVAGTSRYLNRAHGSPQARADHPPFWASQGLYRKSDSRGQLIDTSDGK